MNVLRISDQAPRRVWFVEFEPTGGPALNAATFGRDYQLPELVGEKLIAQEIESGVMLSACSAGRLLAAGTKIELV